MELKNPGVGSEGFKVGQWGEEAGEEGEQSVLDYALREVVVHLMNHVTTPQCTMVVRDCIVPSRSFKIPATSEPHCKLQ